MRQGARSAVLRAGVVVWSTVVVMAAQAHPGGLNKEGCHNNRKTGEYHCHRGAPAHNSPAARLQEDEPTLLAPKTPVRGDAPLSRPFRNCTEARAFGAAPVRRGEPGYGPHLDRDNDGVGCEPYRGR